MTPSTTVAQAAANSHPELGAALHLTSRIRGRMDALESAIAAQDARARLRALTEIFDLLNELQGLPLRRAA